MRNRKKALLLVSALAVGMAVSGCSEGSGTQVAYTATAVVAAGIEQRERTVSYEQLMYVKYSDNPVQSSVHTITANEPDSGLRALYERYWKAAPGGFIVKEDAEAYFLCVSAGSERSDGEGFRIESIRLISGPDRTTPALTIALEPHEDGQISGMREGEVFVTSLIRIPKQSLPAGTEIADISLVGV